MIQIFKILLLFAFFSLLSCSNYNKKYQDKIVNADNLNEELLYKKVAYFVDKYDVNEDEKLRLKGGNSSYHLDDSLCFYLSKLDKRKVLNDEYFKYLMGKLLEKKYLGVRNSGVFEPDFFAVYNASILTYERLSNRFALNIIINQEINIDSSFTDYAIIGTDFICIDSVILHLDKLPQMQNDSIHRICKKLVDTNQTGGCKW